MCRHGVTAENIKHQCNKFITWWPFGGQRDASETIKLMHTPLSCCAEIMGWPGASLGSKSLTHTQIHTQKTCKNTSHLVTRL